MKPEGNLIPLRALVTSWGLSGVPQGQIDEIRGQGGVCRKSAGYPWCVRRTSTGQGAEAPRDGQGGVSPRSSGVRHPRIGYRYPIDTLSEPYRYP